MVEELKQRIKQDLPELDIVIGWTQGYDALHVTPYFMQSPEDVDSLVYNPLCVHNLATYLPQLKGKKVGLLVKGCDSRSVVELIQEKLIERENLTIYGIPCTGIVDLSKLQARVPDWARVSHVDCNDSQIEISTRENSYSLQMRELLPRKCQVCNYPNPVEKDYLFGQEVDVAAEQDSYFDLEELFSKTLQERMQYWQGQMERCLRCYACRNACPMCVCKDHCIAETRDPHWMTQETNVKQKLMFQLIHAMHLAGRCTECGECERACPMDIPVLTFKRQLNKEIKDLFEYEAGVDMHALPPILTYQVEEKNIKEKEW